MSDDKPKTNVYDGIPYDFAVSEGICAQCGDDEILADHEGRMLCERCWHSARYALSNWRVKRNASPEHEAEYGPCYTDADYTQAEAEADAAKRNRSEGGRWIAIAGPCCGNRIAHPGYMSRRRREIIAAHPKYAEKPE